MTIAYFAFQNTTAPADTDKWNDVRKNTASLGLVDAGVATGWTIGYPVDTNAISGNGANAVGTGDAAWVDEAIIMYEGHYHGDAVNWKVVEITGVDDARLYNLAFTASQPVDRKTEVRVNGGTSQVLNADGVQQQTDDAIFFNDVSPVSGKITIEYRSVTGSSAYLMAGYIEEQGASVSITGDLTPGASFTINYTGFTGVPVSPATFTDSAGNSITVAVTISDNGDGTGTASGTMPALPSSGSVSGLKFGTITASLSTA